MVVMGSPRRVVHLVISGAPPARDARLVIPRLRSAGWDAFVVPTPNALMFLDPAELSHLSGNPVRAEFSAAPEDRLPPPEAVIAAPATLNTINKWATGISDTLAIGVLIEAMGSDVPVTTIPWAKDALRRHPAFSRNLDILRSCGVRIIDREQQDVPLDPRQEVPDFPWDLALDQLRSLARSSSA